MNKKIKLLVIASAIGISGSAWADAQEEVNKQIAKLIGDAVSSRIATSITPSAQSQLPNNVWASYSRLTVDPEGSSSIGTDIGVVGYDRDYSKDWVFGAALSYNNSNKFDADGWGIAPYAAYRFNKQIFAVVRAGYGEFDFDGGSGDITNVALSLNGIHNFDKVYGQWRAEIGFSDADVKAGGVNSSSSATNYIGDGELGYRFGDGFKGFVGLQLSDTNRPDSYFAFARIGLEKEIGKDAAISAKYERKVDDDLPRGADMSVDTFTIAARLRF